MQHFPKCLHQPLRDALAFGSWSYWIIVCDDTVTQTFWATVSSSMKWKWWFVSWSYFKDQSINRASGHIPQFYWFPPCWNTNPSLCPWSRGGATYLDALDNVFKYQWALGPGAHQLHSPVEVLDIFTIHLEERGQLLQDVSKSGVHIPSPGNEIITHIAPVKGQGGTGTSQGTMRQWPDSQVCVIVGKLVTLSKPYFPLLYHMG